MSRIARIVGVGYPHHIIQRGNNKQVVFFDDEDRQIYLILLKKYTNECRCKVNAYCLMSNHVHLLLIPQYETSLSKTMQKLSLCYTQHINKKYKKTGRLWECRFHSCIVDSERYLWSVSRYIERNPVRAGIISKPVQYEWSSAKVNTSLSHQNYFVEPIWQSHLEKEEYANFLNQPDNQNEIEKVRKSTLKGTPMGTDEFLENIAKNLGVVIKRRPRGRPYNLKQNEINEMSNE